MRKVACVALVLVGAFVLIAAMSSVALAGASIIKYTAQETMLGPPNITSVTVCGNGVVKATMANHLQDFNATDPWGNADVVTHTSWVIHTDDDVWTDGHFVGTYYAAGPYGDQEGWMTGSFSFLTGVSDYWAQGKGVSGDLIGTVWLVAGHTPGFGALTEQTATVIVPKGS